MGLLTSVNNINYRLEEEKKAKEAERKAKEKERQKAKEEKEAKERIKKEITFYLQDTFKNYLLKNGSNTIYEFYNINKKELLLNEILKDHTFEKTIKLKNGNTYTTNIIEYKDFILEYFNNNYYKILKQVEAETKKNEEYIYYKTLTTPSIQAPATTPECNRYNIQNKNKNNNINKIMNIILISILFILCFPIAILIAACKNQK